MKAFILDRYGKGDLRLGDLPSPELRATDVLVEIRAAGVNLLDTKIRDGEFKAILRYRLPIALGHDLAGVVTRVGAEVTRFKVGDEVYARVADGRIGTFAEWIAVDQNDLAIRPKTITMEEAASLPLVALTAWQTLIEMADVKKGQKVFIHAGSGGVGTFAIQLAKYLGATVATTTSAANKELVKALGADIVIDYRTEDFTQRLQGYDVVLASQDAATLEKSLSILKSGGRLISISGPPDPAFAKSIRGGWLLEVLTGFLSAKIRKLARRKGVSYRFHFMRADGAQLSKITPLVEAGIIRPVLDRVYPFAGVNDALAFVEAGRAKGKVVVKVR